MPRPPITIDIATSRLSLAVHGVLGAAVVGLVATVSPWWGGMLAALMLAGVMVTLARQRPPGQLRGRPTAAGGIEWSWRENADRPWHAVGVRCDYLGPWLIGLKIEGRRCWLWPDSSDAESLRRLRRELLPLP